MEKMGEVESSGSAKRGSLRLKPPTGDDNQEGGPVERTSAEASVKKIISKRKKEQTQKHKSFGSRNSGGISRPCREIRTGLGGGKKLKK